MKIALLLIACAATAGGCVEGLEDEPEDVPDGPPPRTDGVYGLSSTFPLEETVLVPPGAGTAAVGSLEALRDRPAEAMFALAERGGAEGVATVREDLERELGEAVDGLLDGAVQARGTAGGPITAAIATLHAIGAAKVTALRVESRLVLAGEGGLHRAETVEVEVNERLIGYDLAQLLGAPAPDVPLVVSAVPGEGATELTLEAHALPLPYGALAWRVTAALFTETLGVDLRAAIAVQVDCAGAAAAVAARCDPAGCAKHEAALRTICERALDQAALDVQQAIEASANAPLELVAGTARALDGTPADGAASVLDGLWSATIDPGQEPRDVTGELSGAAE
jgi:hypothetical protein